MILALALSTICADIHIPAQESPMLQPASFVVETSKSTLLHSLESATTWLNSPPLDVAQLRGRVVLVSFWTYSCINWRRTLPYLRAWDEKYRVHGLVIVGVHTPEFRFETELDNIRAAARAQDVRYPVAVDSEYAIWDAFGNHYWPAVYLLDGRGRLRDHQYGEGGYEQIEAGIQQLLREAGRDGFEKRPVRVTALGAEADADWRNLRSPETYVGTGRASSFVSVRTVLPDRSRLYTYPSRFDPNTWAVAGSWKVATDSALSLAARGRVAFRFHARDLHLVMGPAARGAAIPFRVTIDGKPPGPAHGVDIDAEGRGMLDAQRMYQLIRQSGQIEPRLFEIEFLEPGAEVFVFTFG